MIISGLQKTSFIDYPEKTSAIIFTRGCNFRCKYCHNPELVDPDKYFPEIAESEILSFLRKRQGVLDGVVITGGEPTIYKDLPEFINKIRDLDLLVKLDTNGMNFKMLEDLTKQGKIDYVAMDIKHSLDKYSDITGVISDDIAKSIKFLLANNIPYEFRTTILPKFFKKQDFHEIGRLIQGAKKYYLQQFRPQKTLDLSLSEAKSFTTQEIEEFKEIMDEYVDDCEIRGII